MGAIGIALVWGAYTGGLWGWCLITGRNVSLKQLLSFSQWPPGSPSAAGTPGGSTPASGPAAGAAEGSGGPVLGGTGTTQAPGTTTAGGRG